MAEKRELTTEPDLQFEQVAATGISKALKPGLATTEFWLSVVTIAAATTLCALGKIGGGETVAVLTGSSGLYSLSRGIAKQ